MAVLSVEYIGLTIKQGHSRGNERNTHFMQLPLEDHDVHRSTVGV